MTRKITLADGRRLEWNYFVEWRPYLWAKPVRAALSFLGDVSGKRVLEIGGYSGRMTALFALLGAEVTMLQLGSTECARAEVEKWGVAGRVRLLSTDGGFARVEGETFDVVFTKSVLWSIPDLGSFIAEIDGHLDSGGKVAFVENSRGGKFVSWLRESVVHRKGCPWAECYYGITKDQLRIFPRHFDRVETRLHRWFVYEIVGYKRRVEP